MDREIEFLPGQEIDIKGAAYIISGISGGTVIYHYKRGGRPLHVPIEKFRKMVQQGTVRLVDGSNGSPKPPSVPYFCDLDEASRSQAEMRKTWLDAISNAGTPPLGVKASEHIKEALRKAALRAGLKHPSVATAYRWAKRYTDSGGELTALVGRDDRKGNRSDRLSPEARNLIDSAIEEWLSPLRPTRRWVYGILVGRVTEINGLREDAEEIEIPSFTTFCNAVKKINPVVLTERRYGKDVAQRKFKTSAGRTATPFPLQRVEFDHTPVDLLVVHGKVVLGRPFLTVAVCACTRAIVGLHLSFNPPSYHSVMSCLKHVLQKKDCSLDGIDVTNNSWDTTGVPVEIITDNGQEFIGENLRLACSTLGISLKQMPRGEPWFKGGVERLFRSMNLGLFHNLAGTTKSNILDRSDYDSVGSAEISYQQLMRLILSWTVDIYMQSPHRGIGTSPAVAWRRGVQLAPVSLPSADINLDIVLGYTYTRKVSSGRIQLHNIQYYSAVLSVLSPMDGPTLSVTVKLNPMNLASVHILHPITKNYFEAFAVPTGYAAGLQLHIHLILQKEMRKQGEAALDFDALYVAKLALARQALVDVKKRTRTTKQKVVRVAQWAETQAMADQLDNTDVSFSAFSQVDEKRRENDGLRRNKFDTLEPKVSISDTDLDDSDFTADNSNV